jgi:hypothetical protein
VDITCNCRVCNKWVRLRAVPTRHGIRSSVIPPHSTTRAGGGAGAYGVGHELAVDAPGGQVLLDPLLGQPRGVQAVEDRGHVRPVVGHSVIMRRRADNPRLFRRDSSR